MTDEFVAYCDQTVVNFGIGGEVVAEVAEDRIAEVEVGKPVGRSSDDSWKQLVEQHVEERVADEPLEVDHGVVGDHVAQSAIAVDRSHCEEDLVAEAGELEGQCKEPDSADDFGDILVVDLELAVDHYSLAGVAGEGREMGEIRLDLPEFRLDHLEEVLHRAAAGIVREEVAHTRIEAAAVAVDDVGEGQEAAEEEENCIAEQPCRTRCVLCRQQVV